MDRTLEHTTPEHQHVVPLYRPSTTAIPRPISGTSRRASSTLFALSEQKHPPHTPCTSVTAITSPTSIHQQDHLRNTLYKMNNAMPPTSYPKASVPRSNSYVSSRARLSVDLSSVQEQLSINSHSMQTLSDHTARTKTALSVSARKASGFRTPAKLDLKRREITPRSLMKPIQPSMPRSQTTGNLTCFPGSYDLSPAKPARKSSLRQSFNSDGNTINVVDALSKNRIVRHEIDLMDKLGDETANNQRRAESMKGSRSSRTNHQISSEHAVVPSGGTIVEASTPFINVDTADTRRISGKGWTRIVAEPLLVDTKLANAIRNYESSTQPQSTSSSSTTYATISSTDALSSQRSVYQSASTVYWAGRYVAASDTLRKRDCDKLLRPSGDTIPNINSAEFEEEFDKLERTRMDRAISELQTFCKTKSATESLAQFEAEFKKNLSKPPPTFLRSKSDIFWKREKEGQLGDVTKSEVAGIREYSGNSATRQVSTFNAQATIGRLSKLVIKRGGLIKSKTLGDLSLKEMDATAHTPSLPLVTKILPHIADMSKAGKTSQSSAVSGTRARAVGERESRQHPAGEVRKTANGRNELVAGNDSGEGVARADDMGQSRRYVWPLRPSNVEGSGIVRDYSINPSTVGRKPDRRKIPEVNLRGFQHYGDCGNMGNGTIKETVLHQRDEVERMSGGQSSGEYVKKVVGAGIREVRKMSRRVGSMGWGGSTDDLAAKRDLWAQ